LFEQLLEKIVPVMANQTPHKRTVPKNAEEYDRMVDPCVALAFTFRWLAGAQRWDLMYMFDVSKSTLHKWTWRVIKALNCVLRENIAFPTDEPSLDLRDFGVRPAPCLFIPCTDCPRSAEAKPFRARACLVGQIKAVPVSTPVARATRRTLLHLDIL
jgi:hypothetical protein